VTHRATNCLHLARSLAVSIASLQPTPIISKSSFSVSVYLSTSFMVFQVPTLLEWVHSISQSSWSGSNLTFQNIISLIIFSLASTESITSLYIHHMYAFCSPTSKTYCTPESLNSQAPFGLPALVYCRYLTHGYPPALHSSVIFPAPDPTVPSGANVQMPLTIHRYNDDNKNGCYFNIKSIEALIKMLRPEWQGQKFGIYTGEKQKQILF